MKIIFRLTLILAIPIFLLSWSTPPGDIISSGSQPQITADNSGIIRVVFGREDSIFCVTSKDERESFTDPVFVGHVPGMHLGMSRGPQLASSANYSVVTAIDKSGSIHFFQLNHLAGKWEYKGLVNDVAASAVEGLMSIAADANDNFYAVWLDIRHGKKNNICFSSLPAKATKWSKNTLIYISPDEHVCECCKPNVDVRGTTVTVMFRNWLNGSRDLYLLTSNNGGNTFGKAQKLGVGTWKLNGCPMDGGGIRVDNSKIVHTVWQRDGNVYYAKPNAKERSLAKGKVCSIAGDKSDSKKIIVNLMDGGIVKILDLDGQKEINVGKGNFLKSVVLGKDKVLCVWEEDKTVKFKTISFLSATAFAN